MTLGDQTRRRLLIIAGSALLWIVLAGYLVAAHPSAVDQVDRTIGTPIAAYADRHGFVERAAELVAAAFRPVWVITVTVTVAIVVMVRGFRRTAGWLVLVSILCELTTLSMKAAFHRTRPSYAHLQLRDAAFPSGHASASACAAGIAVVLAVLFLRRRRHRRLVALLAIATALAVGFDRLLLGVHGLADVLTGFAVAGFWVSSAAYVVDPTPRHPAIPTPAASHALGSVAVILNPAKVEDPAAFRALVDSTAARQGRRPPIWFETTIEDPGRAMARDALATGAELVIVCGGDGTVRTVCAELAGTGVPVGLVPAGTGNLLARNLNLPLYLNAAVGVALGGQDRTIDRTIDIVRVSGDGLAADEHCLVMAGMGFDAALMEAASEQHKASMGWLAYVVSGARHLMFPAMRVEVVVDGGPASTHRARTVVVGNVGFLQARLPLLPDAEVDDGLLDLVVINPRRFRHWVLVVARVVTRGRKTDQTVNRMTGRRIELRAGVDVPRQVDGDPVGRGRHLVCECLPGKLVVRVPR